MIDLISNVEVFGIENAIKGSKYPFATDLSDVSDEITARQRKLGACEIGTGHDNFLNGIIVQFDVAFTLKAWSEAQRYHFLDFISSTSTMHCINKFDIKKSCNEYVTDVSINQLEYLRDRYNRTKDTEDFLRLIYNIPTGFQLVAKMSTNYRQLKTIYHQRKSHRLPEWREFCRWVETLPYFKELILENA